MVRWGFVCGIAGFTTLEHPVERGRIRRVIETIRHRGPDQQGIYESDVVALGAARLAIIDLKQGDQPMYANEGDVVIAFNGEIYNHASLRDELTALGHRFSTHCDTEVVLRGFLEWDTHVFSRLRGMFAVALWTGSQRRLILARDRMGIKPLYIYHRGRDLYFGSELKTIFEHPEIDRKLDLNGLGYYLSLNYVPAPYTLAEGIEKVLPGEFIEWRNGELYREAWYTLRLAPREDWTLDAAKEELDQLLRESVKEHLISDVPLGVWASGGLDSSAIIHYASQAYSGRLKTFSVSFRGQTCDESPWFREVARKYATDHHEFDLNPSEDLTATIEQISYFSDEPSADAGALPVWFLSKMCRSEVTVALSGEGADELFGGYYTYLADQLAPRLRKVPSALRRMGLALLGLWPVSDEKISFEYKAKRFLGGSLLPPDEAHLYWNGSFSAADKRKLYRVTNDSSPGELMHTLPTEAYRCGELNRYLWLDQRYYLADDILYKCDRMSMAHSLEVRPPFLDHRIVEFAGSLPEGFKVNGRTLKFLLRELMRDKLPESVITRKKEGFDIPAHQWFRGPLRSMLLETLTPAAVSATGVFDPAAVASVVDAHLKRRANHGYALWGLLTLFLWIKRWNIHAGTPARTSLDAHPVLATTN
jgi:asparagine synthase (glutamine-hydrolysing)